MTTISPNARRPEASPGSHRVSDGADSVLRRPLMLRQRASRDLGAALAATGVCTIVGHNSVSSPRYFLLVLLMCAGGVVVANKRFIAAALLPLMRSLFDSVGPFIGLTGLSTVLLLTGEAPPHPVTFVTAVTAACFAGSIVGRLYCRRHRRRTRILVAGSSRFARRLATDIGRLPRSDFVVLGRVGSKAPDHPAAPARLGSLAVIRRVAAQHHVDLVVISSELKTSAMLDELATTCADLPLRVVDSTLFYERAFGRIPLDGLRTEWFRFALDPNSRRASTRAKRALDLAVAAPVGLLAAPLVAALALLIRRDGGPAFFRQERIGLGGQPFTLLKLRSMREPRAGDPIWCAAADGRVTPVGRLIRRTHLDELPQLLNVVRGDMSLVGPRPEQPDVVERLEETVPFYYRRHLARPGITGWAQVRCGYSGSEGGAAVKLSHDLYYLKHGSVALDLLILSETFRTLVVDRQYALEPNVVAGLVGGE